ncbi:hypothetical protein LCGC14_2365480, partial [marine sediment metagenome]
MIDVCLISPPSRAFNHYRPPMALMYISSALENKGVSTGIIDLKPNDPVFGLNKEEKQSIIQTIVDKVVKLQPRYVGIPCCTPEYNEIISLAQKIKERLSNTIVIVGGTHPTLRPQDFFFENTPIDYAVVGEGEITTFELIDALDHNKNLKQLQGLSFTDKKSGQLIRTETRPYIQDLDSLPFPDFKKLDMGYYTTPNPYCIRGIMLSSFYILTGRGCPSSCTFCVSKNLRKIGEGKYLRFRSAKNVVDEIEYLVQNYKIDGFYVMDDAFTLDKRHTIAICDEIIKRKLNLVWGCESRINHVNEELLRKMRKAGCLQVDFGVESG